MTILNVFYLCRINSKLDKARFGSDLHMGPAYQKLIHVSNSLYVNGVNASLVSVPVCNNLGIKRSKIGFVEAKERGVNMISLGAVPNRFLNRIYAMIVFLLFVIRRVGSRDRVVLYNFFPEYIAAALYLFLSKNPAILDIEDAPREDELSLVGIVTRFSYRILRTLCQSKCITVSSKVALNLGLDEPVIVYGASPHSERQSANLADFVDANSERPSAVRFVYGGSLVKETGVDIFCDALSLIAERANAPRFNIEFFVTGFGGEEQINRLMGKKWPNWLLIKVCRNLDFEEYEKLLQICHVGICLKIPGTPMADTTFPSKVVEIIRSSLLLLVTPVSDVPIIFKRSEAIFIDSPYVEMLVDAILEIAESPQKYIEVAEAGILRSALTFGYEGVGRRLTDAFFK